MESSEEEKKLLEDVRKKVDYIIMDSEKRKSTQTVDILTAILLSLATVGSAWCAYQSNLWNGIQTFNLMYSAKAGRLSSENAIKAYQIKSMDAILLMQYINSMKLGDKNLSDFYFSRFDSTLKKATLEWLQKDPFNNVNAPNSPMKMPSYQLSEEKEAMVQYNSDIEKMESASIANNNSDRYVLLTVLFAGVLFFAGIANTLRSNLLRNVCLILSGVIFLITAGALLSMPVTGL